MTPAKSVDISLGWGAEPCREHATGAARAHSLRKHRFGAAERSRTLAPVRTRRQRVATFASFVAALCSATLMGGSTLSHAAETPSGPVEGYRQFKFGASKDEVKAARPCSFAPAKVGENGLTILECLDFDWGGGKVDAGFGFLDGKLMTIIINVPKGKAPGTFEGLAEKYGPPSSNSSRAQFALADVPGNTASVCFAADTVCASVWWEELEQYLTLQYKAKDLDTRLKDLTKRAVQPDL